MNKKTSEEYEGGFLYSVCQIINYQRGRCPAMNDLFLHDSLDTSPVVFSDRILYTPTSFAKTALLYLQEIGSLQAKKPHTSSRTQWNRQ